MPEFAAWDVTRIARDVAEARALPIKIIGAIVARGSDYVEILVNIVKCRREPCVVSVGVFRNVSELHLTQEIALRLQRHLDDQQAR
jgi:hypothetical protein